MVYGYRILGLGCKPGYNFNMKDHRKAISDLISGVSTEAWKSELDLAASKYHLTILWVAIILDPLFILTDYINIPDSWQSLLIIRCSVSVITLLMVILHERLRIPSYVLVGITFVLISLQNAYTYSVIDNDDMLGHNLNYMALLIGASMFALWQWTFSVFLIVVSIVASLFFMHANPNISFEQFFVKGGLLLSVSALFMIVLIKTRYDLTVKEIKARIALKASNEEIQAQAEEIKGINENLEQMVHERTKELEKKNKALEEYAFINAHKLRSPVASILGLINLMRKVELNDEGKYIMSHLNDSTVKLDDIVSSITKAIERGDK
jgi:signal transduction histidine kinase